MPCASFSSKSVEYPRVTAEIWEFTSETYCAGTVFEGFYQEEKQIGTEYIYLLGKKKNLTVASDALQANDSEAWMAHPDHTSGTRKPRNNYLWQH